MRIVIFGTGLYYQNRKDAFLGDNIIAFLDNDHKKQGTMHEGYPVFMPEAIGELDYDLIVLMSTKLYEMKNQLLALGVEEKAILYYGQYYKLTHNLIRTFYPDKQASEENLKRRRLLVITDDINYNGGALTAVYAGIAMQNIGWEVMLATRSCENRLMREIAECGLAISIIPEIPYIDGTEPWLEPYDAVLVNTFFMIRCASIIRNMKPLIWWIHEPSYYYQQVLEEFQEYCNLKNITHINIFAVSAIARENFNCHFPECIQKILPFGIPDKFEVGMDEKGTVQRHSSVVFALIGNLEKRKGQDVFIKAIRQLDKTHKNEADFWIIGKDDNANDYISEMHRLAQLESTIKFYGELTRSQIENIFREIDVLVCASQEETMSNTVVEGMMYGKMCLTTDATGIAGYIDNYRNGLICEAGSVEDLQKKMEWCIENVDKCKLIGENARRTYEEFFSLTAFENRIGVIVEQI